MNISRPALRYHGGKWRNAEWIMSFFPPHQCYVEPFGGAAGVLLQKPRSYAEVYNDLDGDIVNFFRVLRNPTLRECLINALYLTPYSRDEFSLAYEDTADPVEMARRTAIRAEMGFGSGGATKGATGFRTDTQRDYALPAHIWQRIPENMRPIGKRFSGVLIENRPALEVLKKHDTPETLHYVDPPYMHETRVMGSRVYRHEMSQDDHEELLQLLLQLEGFVVLSGYENELYSGALNGWEIHKIASRISAGRGTAIRTECVWLNPACQTALERERQQLGLFSQEFECG